MATTAPELTFFVHGLFGSHCHDEKDKCFFPPKLLQFIGAKSSKRCAQIENGDHNPKVVRYIFGKSVYGDFLKKNPNIIPLTYSWRTPATASLEILKQVVGILESKSTLATSATSSTSTHSAHLPISFICHSMGGIVVHNLLTKIIHKSVEPELYDKIDLIIRPRLNVVIMIGSPILGLSLYYDLLRKDQYPRKFTRAGIRIIDNASLNELLLSQEKEFVEFFCTNLKNPINYPCILLNNRSKKTEISIKVWEKEVSDVSFNDFVQSNKFKWNPKKNRLTFTNKISSVVMGDSVVPIIPEEFEFTYKDLVVVVEIESNRNHAFLLNSRTFQNVIKAGLRAAQIKNGSKLKAKLISVLKDFYLPVIHNRM